MHSLGAFYRYIPVMDFLYFPASNVFICHQVAGPGKCECNVRCLIFIRIFEIVWNQWWNCPDYSSSFGIKPKRVGWWHVNVRLQSMNWTTVTDVFWHPWFTVCVTRTYPPDNYIAQIDIYYTPIPRESRGSMSNRGRVIYVHIGMWFSPATFLLRKLARATNDETRPS